MSILLIELLIIAVFILVNILALFLLRKINRRAMTPFLSNGYTLSQLKESMPNESEENILEIISSFSPRANREGDRFRMTYAPFTEHKDRAFYSKYLNVTERGIRLNKKNDQNDINRTDVINVFVFGGSTTLGYGIKDEDTISSYLEKELNKDGEKKYQVFNCGRQSYISTTESIAFQRFLQEGMHMDEIIFIDGLNDVFHNCPKLRNRSRFSESIESHWDQVDYMYGLSQSPNTKVLMGKFLKATNVIFQDLPIITLIKRIERKILAELIKRDDKSEATRMVESWAKGTDINSLDADKLSSQISELTNTNWDLLRAMARKFSVRATFVLQPVYYVNTDIAKHPFIIKNEHPFWYSIYQKYYEAMIRKNNMREDFVDLSDTFQTISQCTFVDSHHYSPHGNKLIANELAKKLSRKKIETARV